MSVGEVTVPGSRNTVRSENKGVAHGVLHHDFCRGNAMKTRLAVTVAATPIFHPCITQCITP